MLWQTARFGIVRFLPKALFTMKPFTHSGVLMVQGLLFASCHPGLFVLLFGIWILGAAPGTCAAEVVRGWLNWRGPQQNGSSLEKNLPDTLVAKDALWMADFPGQSAPVIANGKLYIMGYLGEGADLQEGVACFDAETGKKLWQRLYNDFLSDTVYQRYATSSAP